MYIDLSTLKPNHVYGLMTQVLIPRPIAWVLSQNEDGGWNLAPFSFFTGISSKPPLLMLSIGKRPEGGEKDTLVNIERRDRFVVHLPTVAQMAEVEASSEPLPAGVSEVEKLALAVTDLPGFDLPRLTASPLALACRRHQLIRLEGVAQVLVIGRIEAIHVDDALVEQTENGRIMIPAMKIDPLCRLGSTEYARLGATLSPLRLAE